MTNGAKLLVGALIMIILQVLLAPIITISSIVPNFMLAFTIACVVSRPDQNHLVFAFVMGLIYDLTSSGPVGAMAFAMVLVCFVASIVITKIPSNSFAISMIAIILSVIFVETIYGVFQLALSLDTSFIDILTYRVLPCTMYDLILSIIMLPIMAKILSPRINPNIDINNIASRR